MASLEMVSTQMFECVPKDRNKRKKDLKVLVRDQLKNCRVVPVDDSGSNKDVKSKEVLECSSRSSVSETEEPLKIRFSNPNPTSSPLETNSNSPGQPENQSRNEIITGASSLVQIWEARSQLSSSSQSQSLIDSRTSSGFSFYENPISSPFSESLNDEAKNNNYDEEVDSCEKESEGRFYLELIACTPRIRGRQAIEDICTMIKRDRKNELLKVANCYAVSKFSPRGCGRLQSMLRIRSYERCIAIQERHQSISLKRFSRGSDVRNFRNRYKTNARKVDSAVETRISSSPVMEKINTREIQEATCKPKIARKAIVSEGTSKKDGLKKPEIEREATEEGKRSRENTEKDIVKANVEEKKTSLSIAENVNLWDSKKRTNKIKTMEKAKNEEKTARRVTYVDATERKKEEVSSFEEGKSMETEEYKINPREVTSVNCLNKTTDEETASHASRKSGKEEISSQDDEKTSEEALCSTLESPRFLNGCDENEMEDYNVYYDWVSDISRPRSHWEDLRRQWEIEVMKMHSEEDDIWKMIKERAVSGSLASDFREKIDKILMSQAKRRLQKERNHVEEEDSEESLVECLASYQEKLEEDETEMVDIEMVTVNDGFSQSSTRSTMMTWSFEDHESAAKMSLNPKDHDYTSSERQMICDLREQIKQLQIEMLELRSLVESLR